jgi:cytochrome P450
MAMDNPAHKHHRRIMQGAFQRRAMERYVSRHVLIDGIVDHLIEDMLQAPLVLLAPRVQLVFKGQLA